MPFPQDNHLLINYPWHTVFEEIMTKDFIKDTFTSESRAIEIESAFGHKHRKALQAEYDEKKNVSPIWPKALEAWITEIDNNLENAGYQHPIEGGINKI